VTANLRTNIGHNGPNRLVVPNFRPVTAPRTQPYKISSADVILEDPSGIGGSLGFVTQVTVPGTQSKVKLEVVATMTVADFNNLISDRPFSAEIQGKASGEVGPVSVEFQGNIVGDFPALSSMRLPRVSARGHVLFGNGVSSAGATWVVDGRGFSITGPITEVKVKNESGFENDLVGVEGKGRTRLTGKLLEALKGGIGGPRSPGVNRFEISGTGKAYVNIGLVTIRLTTGNGIQLILTNDGNNGRWRVKTVDGKIIGEFNLPKLIDKFSGLSKRLFSQATAEIKKLSDVVKIFQPPPVVSNVDEVPIESKIKPLPQNRYVPPVKAPNAQRIQKIPIGKTLTHPKLVAFARQFPGSEFGNIVRALDKIKSASIDSDLWNGIWRVMNDPTGKATLDDNVNGMLIRYTNYKGSLRVAVIDANGIETAYATVTYDKKTNSLFNRKTNQSAWTRVGLDDPVVAPASAPKPDQYRRTLSHLELPERAKKFPQSYFANVVRGLDKVVLADPDSDFAKTIHAVMTSNLTHIENVNGAPVRYSRVGNTLSVAALGPDGEVVAYANVTYNTSTRKLAWKPVNLDRAAKVPDTQAQPDDAVAIYGLDRDLIAAARNQGFDSDPGVLVRALNAVAAAPKDSRFRRRIDILMSRGRPPIVENFTDAQGRNVQVEWSKSLGKLQVKVTRDGSTPALHRVNYPNGNWWIVTDISKPRGASAEDLGNISAVIQKAQANPKSREARILRVIDVMFLNAFAPDAQSKREILKQLSRRGFYMDSENNIRFSVVWRDKGEVVLVKGDRQGRVVISVSPESGQGKGYSMRVAIDEKGIPIVAGSAQRMQNSESTVEAQ
jgi:hypothetical protein